MDLDEGGAANKKVVANKIDAKRNVRFSALIHFNSTYPTGTAACRDVEDTVFFGRTVVSRRLVPEKLDFGGRSR